MDSEAIDSEAIVELLDQDYSKAWIGHYLGGWCGRKEAAASPEGWRQLHVQHIHEIVLPAIARLSSLPIPPEIESLRLKGLYSPRREMTAGHLAHFFSVDYLADKEQKFAGDSSARKVRRRYNHHLTALGYRTYQESGCTHLRVANNKFYLMLGAELLLVWEILLSAQAGSLSRAARDALQRAASAIFGATASANEVRESLYGKIFKSSGGKRAFSNDQTGRQQGSLDTRLIKVYNDILERAMTQVVDAGNGDGPTGDSYIVLSLLSHRLHQHYGQDEPDISFANERESYLKWLEGVPRRLPPADYQNLETLLKQSVKHYCDQVDLRVQRKSYNELYGGVNGKARVASVLEPTKKPTRLFYWGRWFFTLMAEATREVVEAAGVAPNDKERRWRQYLKPLLCLNQRYRVSSDASELLSSEEMRTTMKLLLDTPQLASQAEAFERLLSDVINYSPERMIDPDIPEVRL